jgi:DNA-binding HxlR family transcriptional regulator
MPTMTATQKRAQAKADYDAFLANCPSRQLLDRISDKWVALILTALGDNGPHPPGDDCVGEPRSMRFSELSRRLAGVTVTPTVPVTVTYDLTDLGISLQHLMSDLKRWAEAHMTEVLANREQHDTRVA